MKESTKEPKTPRASMYKVRLEVLGAAQEAKGKTLLEALQNLSLSWSEIKGKGVMTVSKGAASHEHLFNAPTLRRIASNKVVRSFWAKNLNLLLK